VITQLVIG